MNSQSEPVKTVSTSNLLEVSFLLDRSHQITGVERKAGTYGVPELFLTLQGVMIDLDHKSFLLSSTPTTGSAGGTPACSRATLKGLQEAMDAISEAVSEGRVSKGLVTNRRVSG